MGYPVVESLTVTTFSSSTTSHLVNMPATVNAGDLLFILFGAYNQTPTDPGGWTFKWGTFNGPCHTKAYFKVSNGTEGGTTVDITTPVGTTACAQVYRISSWYGDLTGVDTTTPGSFGTGTAPNPPSETASWGAEDNLWFAISGAADDDISYTTAPTNYTNLNSTVSGGGIDNGCSIGSARRNYTNATDNPSAFTLASSESWVGGTIVIRQETYKIEGKTYDNDENILSNCNCLLMKDNLDDTCDVIDYTTSDGSGDYSFEDILDNDSQYFVYAWKDDSPHVMDVTDHNLLPRSTPTISYDLYLRSDVDKGETSPDKDLRLRTQASRFGIMIFRRRRQMIQGF